MLSRSSIALARALSRQSNRSFVSVTNMALEKHTMKVPGMGDSITEGTIVEWTVEVGQAVQEEDVVALIETDKVTVDIKATMAGVLTQQFGEVDETVEMGANLCEIDTEAEATVEGGSSDAAPAAAAADPVASAPAPTPAAAAPAPTPTASQSSSTGARKPSIHFLGKDGWARVLSGQSATSEYIPANYGRLVFSEEEMEALIMGGANIAPEVKDFSSGATFAA